LYVKVIPENPLPVGGLVSLISFASKSKGNNSNFVPGVSKYWRIVFFTICFIS